MRFSLAVLASLLGVCLAGGGAHFHDAQQQIVQDQVVDSEPTNYNFAYAADSHSRSESREGNTVRGQYSLIGADGVSRVVNYIADEYGYRATISTNEPGTESQSPANVILESSQPPAKQLAELYGPQYQAAAAHAPIVQSQVHDTTFDHHSTKGGFVHQAPVVQQIVHSAPKAPVVQAPLAFSQQVVHSAPLLQSNYAPVVHAHAGGVKGHTTVVHQQAHAVKAPVKRVVHTKAPPPPAATKTIVRQPAVKTPALPPPVRKLVFRQPHIHVPPPPAIRSVPPPTTAVWQEPIVHTQQQEQVRFTQEEAQEENKQQEEGASVSLNSFAADDQPESWSSGSS